jgi:hypothetical protein
MPLNLTGVQAKEGNSFEPMPEGLYYLSITDGLEKDEPGKTLQHELEFTVQTGEFAGRKFKHWFVASEKMVPYIKHFYMVCGAQDFSNLNPADFVGKTLCADVIVDEYNNKKNNKLALGMYYEWNGKPETATGTKPEKKDKPASSATPAASKPATPASSGKPAAKKSSPFSNGTSASADEPPF